MSEDPTLRKDFTLEFCMCEDSRTVEAQSPEENQSRQILRGHVASDCELQRFATQEDSRGGCSEFSQSVGARNFCGSLILKESVDR
jgi:hypothetical protein